MRPRTRPTTAKNFGRSWSASTTSRLTLNGHVCHTGLGFLSSKNDHGHMTHQMLVDYQQRQLGGEGYLRILEFLPDGKTVHVKSYSPLYDKYLQDAAQPVHLQARSVMQRRRWGCLSSVRKTMSCENQPELTAPGEKW